MICFSFTVAETAMLYKVNSIGILAVFYCLPVAFHYFFDIVIL